MHTASAIQSSPIKHFLFGLVIGVGSNTIISTFFSILITVFSSIFIYSFYSFVDVLFLINFFIKLALFVAVLIVMQKKLNNKFITIGVAAGFVGSITLLGIQSAMMAGAL